MTTTHLKIWNKKYLKGLFLIPTFRSTTTSFINRKNCLLGYNKYIRHFILRMYFKRSGFACYYTKQQVFLNMILFHNPFKIRYLGYKSFFSTLWNLKSQPKHFQINLYTYKTENVDIPKLLHSTTAYYPVV